MAIVEHPMPAGAAEVFRTLTTPETYPFWLVGCQDIRDVDEAWPAVGSAFHHRVGLAGPVTLADNTKVLDVEDGRCLVLEVRARPAGRGRVTFTITPDGPDRSTLRFEEVPLGLLQPLQPALDPLTVRRNRRSMERLAGFLGVRHVLAAGEASDPGV